jgi:sugar phosphate isomerase/epimerase
MMLSLAAGAVLDTRGVETVRVAHEAGFPAVGLWIETQEWDASRIRETRRALDDSGVVALDVEVVRFKPGVSLDDAKRVVDIGVALGARHLLTISLLPDPSATAEALAELNAYAKPGGLRVVLEFMVFTAVRTLGDAVSIAAQSGGAGVLVDALHLIRSGGSVADLAAVDPHLFPYAQLCDGPAVGPAPVADGDAFVVEALDGRSCPGEGGLDMNGFVAAMPAGTPMSLEIRSKALRDGFPDPLDRARYIFDRTTTWTRHRPGASGHPSLPQ